MTKWDTFFYEKIKKILLEKNSVLDFGGGLRVLKDRGDRFEKSNNWMLPYIDNIDYKIIDLFPNNNPDIIGDIHDVPLKDESQDAIICMSVLEHVENPIKACKELYRILRPGGYCFVYVPFLYYYHSEGVHYGDYWRFTHDTIALLFKDFSNSEIQNLRGALETWLYISPLGRITPLVLLFRFMDGIFGKRNSNQTSGYYIFLVK